MTQTHQKSPSSLSRKVVRGTFWSYVSIASGKLLNFLTTIILARLLVPEQFGLVGYCTIAIQYLDIMNTAGINAALIARKEKLEEACNAAFIINIVMGFITYGLAWVSAPFIADFFHAKEVTDIFRVIALVLPITGFGLVPDTLVQRGMRFRARLAPEISRTFLKGLVSITLALLGWGVWSLVWGQITGSLVYAIVSWMIVDWKPSLKFDWQVSKELIGYGSHIILIGLTGALQQNVDYMIVGKLLGAAALGFYTMAYRIPELAIKSLNEVAAEVLFPALSQIQTDVESLRKFYFNYIRFTSIFTFSVGTGLCLTSDLFIKSFMSDKWAPVIIPMTIISAALGLASIGYVPGVLYKAINRPEILSKVSIAKIPVYIVLLIIGTYWGINGVAAGQLILALFSIILDSVIVSRVVKFNISEFIGSLAPATISSAVMAIVVVLVQYFFTPTGWLGLVITILLGAVVFSGTLFLVSRQSINQILMILRKENLRL